jgi:hypothetical protein
MAMAGSFGGFVGAVDKVFFFVPPFLVVLSLSIYIHEIMQHPLLPSNPASPDSAQALPH